jgi:dihydrofolate synthase/folylpolyglutamate synthase
LAQLAPKICPELETIQVFDDLVGALDAALNSADTSQRLIVLCGSLYLVGYFLEKQLNQHSSKT